MMTHEELKQLLPRLERSIERTETERPEARPLPPMTVDECEDFFCRIMDIAATRPLTPEECFLHGQLQCVLIQAARAEALGKRGRYFVISMEDLERAQRDTD